MSADKLGQLHEILKDQLRQKILLKLGEHNDLSFDELMKELKMDNREEVYNQLNVLGDLVSQTESDEYLLSEQGVSKKPGGQYKLTEKDQDAINEMIAFPEIKSENYKEEVNRKYFSQKAVNRLKLFYVLLGAGGGYAFFFLTGAVISIISVQVGGSTLINFQNGWPLFGDIALIATIPGAFLLDI
jgi:DNA-binding HxlR family transcriptional regulator